MTTKHRPGPWNLARNEVQNRLLIKYSLHTGGPLAYISVEDSEEGEANARLIAAAPELLAALKEVVAEFDAKADELPPGYMQRDTGGIAYARTIIAKATQ